MSTASKKTILAGILAASISATAFAAESVYGAAAARATADPTVEQMLGFAIQDEYLARAEYELIISSAGNVGPFRGIAAAEARHVEWVASVMRERGFAVPADESAKHAALPEGVGAAYQAGVQAEIDNIAMYDGFLKRDLPDDVRALFERLRAASENHLRAFRRSLARTRSA